MSPPARAPYEKLAAFLRSPSGWIAAALVVLGIYLRTRAFDFPTALVWDEYHFVDNARSYLAGSADANDHPPLGKLVIAAFMQLFGDTPRGWRLGAWFSGVLTILCGAVAVARLFRSLEAGLVAAGLFAADGFLIAYSRVALLDGYLALSVALALLLLSFRMSPVASVLAGVLVGSATSVKFSGVGLFLPLLAGWVLAPLTARRRVAYALLMIATGVLAYLAWFVLGLSLSGQPASLVAAVEKTVELFEHHAELTDMKHPLTSGWVTWALPVRPIVIGDFPKLDHTRMLSSLGNVALWWPVVAFAVITLATLGFYGVKSAVVAGDDAEPGAVSPRAFIAVHGRAVLMSSSAALGLLAPWVMSHRDSYIHHFLPVYVALIVLFAGFVGFARERYRVEVLAWLVLVLLVAAFYAPIWSFMPISHDAVRARLFLPSWQ